MTRAGHSLPELIVALVFVGVAMAAIAGGSLLAARVTTDAVRSQEAVARAAALLDSLVAAPAVIPGELLDEGMRAAWTFGADGPGGTVEVRITAPPGAPELARLEGYWIPLPPVPPNPPIP